MKKTLNNKPKIEVKKELNSGIRGNLCEIMLIMTRI